MSSREERVLVLAPTGRDASLTCTMLHESGLVAEACPSIADLCGSIADGAGALLIAEEALPPSAVHLLGQTLDDQAQWSDIPVIVLAGGEFSASSLRPLNLLGPLRNVMILERPVRRLILIRTVAVALRARARQYELRTHLEERSELLDRERQARAEAEKVNRMKDEFLMTVSHELRTPLTAIYGWARMLVTGQIRDELKHRAIETIERNAQAQTQLVNDLLDVSRAISGKVRLDIRSVDLAAVVAAAVDSIQPAAEAKSIRVETDLDPAAGPISGDPARLQQIIWNLLSNAIKFTPVDGRVSIRLTHQADHLEIAISDTGTGIAPEFAPYVFDRFRQGDAGTTRQYGGLGLGLAIVRHLVELHGGTVSAESPGIGCGATFRVVLPFVSAQKGKQRREDRPGRLVNQPPAIDRLDGLRILIVDDEFHARELFTTIVENAGAETRQAASAHDALEILATWWPDVLLSDVEMPHQDGHQLMARVSAVTGDDRPPIAAIAVTAHSRSEDRRRALASGFKWHLPKPIEPSELVAVIASLTGPSRDSLKTVRYTNRR